MATEVKIPQLEADLSAAHLTRWLVTDGSFVTKGDPIFELETAKAAIEIESPATGRITGIVAASDAPVPVGDVVAWIVVDDTDELPRAAEPQPSVPKRAGRSPATPLARKLARERGTGLGDLSGSGVRGRIEARDIPAAPIPVRAAMKQRSPLTLDWLRQGQGAPLVVLHGFGSELSIWKPLLSGVELTRPIVGIDLPGHGRSASATMTSFDDMVDSVSETLLTAEIRSADLLGHSLGGAVAAALTKRSALHVRSLSLLAPAGLGPDINRSFLEGFLAARSEASLSAWMQILVASPDRLSPVLVKATMKVRQGERVLENLQRVAAILFPDGTQAFSVRDTFDKVTAPVRVVFGTEDRIIPASHVTGLPGHVAVHLFRGVGHLPHLEIPAEIARILTANVRSAG